MASPYDRTTSQSSGSLTQLSGAMEHSLGLSSHRWQVGGPLFAFSGQLPACWSCVYHHHREGLHMPEYPRWDKGSSSTRRLGLFVVLFGLFLVVQIPFSVRAVQSAVGDVLLPMILGGADQSAATPAVTPEVTPPQRCRGVAHRSVEVLYHCFTHWVC